MAADLALVAREAEFAVLTAMLEAVRGGRGDAALVVGEAGIGKTRLLSEARRCADRLGLPVFRGRATETGGAYRPLVDAFARPAAGFATDPAIAALRPTLARLLPGWAGDRHAATPMADPAAVLAEALIALLQVMAPDGAVLIVDDLHWADEDTLSVLTYLADTVEDLPLALLLAARDESPGSAGLEQLIAGRSVRRLGLRRLTDAQVTAALAAELPALRPDAIDQLAIVIDGLPLILDEFVRQLRETSMSPAELDVGHTTLSTAVQLRLSRLSPAARAVLDALAVLGETDGDVLAAASRQEPEALTSGIHEGVASTLLVPGATRLGVVWRHRLMRDAVRNLLLPLEQQAMARRAADQLTAGGPDLTDGEWHQAAALYALAGYPNQAADQLIKAARVAVRRGGLNAADHYLAEAQALTGTVPAAAREVLIEHIEVLALAGRAGDAYQSGLAALQDVIAPDQRLIVATARAAVGADLYAEAAGLLARIDDGAPTDEPDLAVLRAHVAVAHRRPEATALGELAVAAAQARGRFDIACESWLAIGRAGRRRDTDAAAAAFHQATALGERHQLPLWQVRALAELGLLDLDEDSDSTRFRQARELAVTAGMVGLVAFLDLWIGATIAMREGFVSAYPTLARADTQSRQLRLVGVHAQTRAWLAQCLVHADGETLPGRTAMTGPTEVDDLVAEAVALGLASKPVLWAPGVLALRAWFHGDTAAAIRLFEESLFPVRAGKKLMPWWGVWALLRTVTDSDPKEALDTLAADDFTGHHINQAALAYGRAVLTLRSGGPVDELLAEAEFYTRHTPFIGHLLRTVIAPTMFTLGVGAAQGWLREAEAFCSNAGERALQRRVHHGLAAIGAKASRRSAGAVPPHIARLGITARECEILRLVNAGLSNPDIAGRLVISIRTVETHVSSMLQKTGQSSRERLPSAAPQLLGGPGASSARL